jgi:hypothetical protein
MTHQVDEQDYSGAGSLPVDGAAQRPVAELAAADLTQLPPSPARPSWMVTSWPVSAESYAQLVEAAAQPTEVAPEAAAAIVEDPAGEAGYDAAAALAELPEDEGVGEPAAAAPGIVASFDGIPQTAWQPPDNTIAVGPSDVLVAVNADLAGYTKAGVLRFRWPNMTTLFQAVLPAGASVFDPRVAYDHYTQRWIVVTGARRQTPAGSWLMVGVSQGADPAGGYWVWALDATLNGSAPTGNWADYPMLGFDTQAIYISSNMFALNGGFQYAKLRILNKAELYAGGLGPSHSIRWYDLWNLRNPDNSLAFAVQPAVHFRGTGGNPPANLINGLWPSGRSLTLWTLTNPLALWTGGVAALTRVAVQSLDYDLPPAAQQQGTATSINTNDPRLLNAVYQFAGGVQRLWTCHTVKHTWPNDPAARSAVQWYEIDVPGHQVVQQNRYGATGRYYFFPAIQTDAARNAYVVFGRSSSTEYAQLRQSGRRVGDPPGTLQGSALVAAGAGLYDRGRWGDYFGICRDPGVSTTVWMYGEYAQPRDTWGTRVCAASFP